MSYNIFVSSSAETILLVIYNSNKNFHNIYLILSGWVLHWVSEWVLH